MYGHPGLVGCLFADKSAVQILFLSLDDSEAYRFCLDFVSVLRLSHDAFETEVQGLATKPAVHMADYKYVASARMTTSFNLTHPETIIQVRVGWGSQGIGRLQMGYRFYYAISE